MTDDLGRLSFPAANGATGDSVSAPSIGSNGGAKVIDASDVKPESTVTFLIAEINKLAEQISAGAYGSAEGIDASDVKARSTVAFLIAETNRLAEENQRLKDKLALLDVEKRLALLKETFKSFRTNEFLSSVCLIAGSAGVGAGLNYLSLNTYAWNVFIGMSAMLVLAGIVARVGGLSLGTTTRQPDLSSK
jgi:hypothetical protein